jgi:hypothetical protein
MHQWAVLLIYSLFKFLTLLPFQDKDGESISFGEKDKEFKIDRYRVYNTSFFGLGACIGPAFFFPELGHRVLIPTH